MRRVVEVPRRVGPHDGVALAGVLQGPPEHQSLEAGTVGPVRLQLNQVRQVRPEEGVPLDVGPVPEEGGGEPQRRRVFPEVGQRPRVPGPVAEADERQVHRFAGHQPGGSPDEEQAPQAQVHGSLLLGGHVCEGSLVGGVFRAIVHSVSVLRSSTTELCCFTRAQFCVLASFRTGFCVRVLESHHRFCLEGTLTYLSTTPQQHKRVARGNSTTLHSCPRTNYETNLNYETKTLN